MTAPDKIFIAPDFAAEINERPRYGRFAPYHHQSVVDELVEALHRLAKSIENAQLLTDPPNTQKGLMLIDAKKKADALIAKHRKGSA